MEGEAKRLNWVTTKTGRNVVTPLVVENRRLCRVPGGIGMMVARYVSLEMLPRVNVGM